MAFWIGHRHSLYANWPLGESALVAEVCNLIYANREPDMILLCEGEYLQLMPSRGWPDRFGPKARADLVVLNGISHREPEDLRSLTGHMTAVIEVKRAFAPRSHIDQDLKRLATVKHANTEVRALLFVIAESRRPGRFVTEKGNAILGKHNISGADAHYRVRRACKAAASFSGKESAHYACIVEVFIGAYQKKK